MITKTLSGAALLLSTLLAAGAAQAGNTASIPARAIASAPSAREASVRYTAVRHPDGYECRYQGGPKFPMVHAR